MNLETRGYAMTRYADDMVVQGRLRKRSCVQEWMAKTGRADPDRPQVTKFVIRLSVALRQGRH